MFVRFKSIPPYGKGKEIKAAATLDEKRPPVIIANTKTATANGCTSGTFRTAPECKRFWLHSTFKTHA